MKQTPLERHLEELHDLQRHAGVLRAQAAIEVRLAARHTAAAKDLRREAEQTMAEAERLEAEWDG